MLPDRVSNPGPLTYESGALPIALNFYMPEVFMLVGIKVSEYQPYHQGFLADGCRE